jgi:tRNA dimethylallyltransferase
MNKKNKTRVPVILGPTAVGKTDLSLRLATDLGFEIISCDSRQIYRYMNIGTAKPSIEQMEDVRHWMIDIIEPSEYYSAYRFSQEAIQIIRDSAKRKKVILICGGTGLYFKSLSEGLGPQIGSNIAFREKYKKRVSREGVESVFEELKKCDPEAASRLHPNDVQRVIRALQVFHETCRPLSELQKENRPLDDIEFFVVILSLSRDTLYGRINERVDRMISEGLWDEFNSLCEKDYGESDPGMQCVGYKEFFDVKKGKGTVSEAGERIKRNTRNYAKRQMTWFKNKESGVHIDISDSSAYSAAKEEITNFLYL